MTYIAPRTEALRICRRILERAEHERIEVADREAERGLQYGHSGGELPEREGEG